MQAEEGAPNGQQACVYVRPPIAEAILVILLALTAKTALDHFFVGVPSLGSTTKVWEAFTFSPGLYLFLFLQLIIFFFTAFRFYLGSLRYHQMRGHYKHLRTLIFDLGSNTIIFVGFYLCALAINSSTSFYVYVAILHLFDLLWFLLALIRPTSESQQVMTMLKRFILYDLVTLGLFGAFSGAWWLFHFTYGSPYMFQFLCLGVLLVVGIVDFKQNSAFYRGERTA